MDNVAIQSVQNIDAPAKAWLEKVVGRELRDDEQVSVRVFSVRPPPPATVREASGLRLEQRLDKMAENMKDLSQEEVDAALDEALKRVRPA